MIRHLALAASLLAATAAPALAQTYQHGPGHVRPDSAKNHPHGPGHVWPDSAPHAAMHAYLLGGWTGTLQSHQGTSSRLSMSVARDSVRSIALIVNAEHSARFGAARDFAVNGDRLTWTQDLAGAPCKAAAIVTAGTPKTAGELKGKMTCERDEFTFALRKNAG